MWISLETFVCSLNYISVGLNTHGSGSMGWFERRAFLKEITQKGVIYRRNCEKENGLFVVHMTVLQTFPPPSTSALASWDVAWTFRYDSTTSTSFFSSQSQASTKKKKNPSSCKVVETPHGLIWWRIWEEGDGVGQSHEEKRGNIRGFCSAQSWCLDVGCYFNIKNCVSCFKEGFGHYCVSAVSRVWSHSDF